jgi:hypothetical protein
MFLGEVAVVDLLIIVAAVGCIAWAYFQRRCYQRNQAEWTVKITEIKEVHEHCSRMAN